MYLKEEEEKKKRESFRESKRPLKIGEGFFSFFFFLKLLCTVHHVGGGTVRSGHTDDDSVPFIRFFKCVIGKMEL